MHTPKFIICDYPSPGRAFGQRFYRDEHRSSLAILMTDIASSPIDRIMRKAGAERVSEEGVEALREVVETLALEVSREAIALAKHAGRKTVNAEDVKMASRKLMALTKLGV
ncbi:MAG: histone family protein [Candidatus Methanomethylicia archaeon]|nr:histone family protein [Candidatus Methanomethylicia archaeon]